MKVLAENLTASGNLILKFAEQVADEAICMAAAQRRFEERAAKTKKADR
jgi:hypothetical protein